MASKINQYALYLGALAFSLGLAGFVPALIAQQSPATAAEALKKAQVQDRLATLTPPDHKGTSPSFVLDPAWPQPLPHHWLIGDVGGIAVDKHKSHLGSASPAYAR
jgi:hypothetical protein